MAIRKMDAPLEERLEIAIEYRVLSRIIAGELYQQSLHEGGEDRNA